MSGFLPRDALVEYVIWLGLGQRVDPVGLALGIDNFAGVNITGLAVEAGGSRVGVSGGGCVGSPMCARITWIEAGSVT